MATTAIPASYVIFVRDGRVLLHLRGPQSKFYGGWWGLPAGHVEPGELPADCAVREAEEEVGLQVRREDLEQVAVMYQVYKADGGLDDNTRLELFYLARSWTGEPENREPAKCAGLAWHALDALPANTIPYIRAALGMWQRGQHWAEGRAADIAAANTPQQT